MELQTSGLMLWKFPKNAGWKQGWGKRNRHPSIYTWNPNDFCFEWRKGPSFGWFKPQNRGQTGSRYIYIILLLLYQLYYTPRSSTTRAKNHSWNDNPLFYWANLLLNFGRVWSKLIYLPYLWVFYKKRHIHAWNPKQPDFYGCFNWMIPNLYLGNGCFTKHPLKTGCLGFQVDWIWNAPYVFFGSRGGVLWRFFFWGWSQSQASSTLVACWLTSDVFRDNCWCMTWGF